MSRPRIVVGLSGGVDSAVSAWLLREQGWEVIGLFMKNWEDDDDDQYCSTRQDWIDAASVADRIGIDLEAVNFAAEYRDRVFAEFLREYSAGRTPNPDVLCNAEIKFKAFLDQAMRMGAECIATGHYARVRTVTDSSVEAGVRHELLRGVDVTKDQSYFLHRLNQAQLARARFPVGELPKTQVREIARRIGLPNHAKKDSTGICFIGERPFREFLSRYLPTARGPIITDSGKTVGEHVGLAFYTLGQRKGIGVGGQRAGSGEAWYVARKDMQSNTLYVVQGHDHPWLQSTVLHAHDAHWIAGVSPQACSQTEAQKRRAQDGVCAPLAAKTRYRQTDSACRLMTDADDPRRFGLCFDAPQWAVTPGQSAVLYQGEVCLGGGVIGSMSESISPTTYRPDALSGVMSEVTGAETGKLEGTAAGAVTDL